MNDNPKEQLRVMLARIGKDFDAILKNEFVMSADNKVCAALFSAKESLDNAAALAGPKGDSMAASIQNGSRAALDLAGTHIRAALEQFAVASEAGMKPFTQWRRLYESAQTLPAFVSDAKAAQGG